MTDYWSRAGPAGWSKGCTHLWDLPGPQAVAEAALARTPLTDRDAPTDLRVFPRGFGAACKSPPSPYASPSPDFHAHHPVGPGDWRYAHAHLGTDQRSTTWSAFGPPTQDRQYEEGDPNKPPGLKYDWRAIAYTDGSVVKPRSGTGAALVGAAVFMPCAPGTGQPMTHLVAPGGDGPSNTITRAELAAVYAGLSLGATTIMSDSAAALWLIRRAVVEPMTLRRHLHRPLLEAIVDLIRAAGSPVTLLKCKAHSGLYGNEMADRAAKLAGMGRSDMACEVAAHPFEPMYWPVRRDEEDDTAEHTPAKKHIHYLGDLSKGLRAAAKETCSLGSAPTDGLCATAWRDTIPHTHRELSNGFATGSAIGLATKRRVWKARCRLIWNKKLEKLYNKQGDDRCPLCGQQDGTRHILGGCSALAGLYTERHNAVGRLILKALRLHSSEGAEIVQHDVGSAAKLANDGVGSTCSRMVPASTLPDEVLARHGCARSDCSRPDITLDSKSAERNEPRRNEPRFIRLVEIKVCNDTDDRPAWGRAETQHEALLHMLRSLHGRDRVSLIPLLFGSAGTIFTSTRASLLGLGLSPSAADRTLAKIHTTLCRHLHSIGGARRAKERMLKTGGT